MFLAPADRDGIVLERHVRTVDRSMLGGRCEISFTDVFVPDDDVLAEVDLGYKYAQVRLGPDDPRDALDRRGPSRSRDRGEVRRRPSDVRLPARRSSR